MPFVWMKLHSIIFFFHVPRFFTSLAQELFYFFSLFSFTETEKETKHKFSSFSLLLVPLLSYQSIIFPSFASFFLWRFTLESHHDDTPWMNSGSASFLLFIGGVVRSGFASPQFDRTLSHFSRVSHKLIPSDVKFIKKKELLIQFRGKHPRFPLDSERMRRLFIDSSHATRKVCTGKLGCAAESFHAGKRG